MQLTTYSGHRGKLLGQVTGLSLAPAMVGGSQRDGGVNWVLTWGALALGRGAPGPGTPQGEGPVASACGGLDGREG